ncbi:MAG: TauD/TfdA dioxygenase family protein [Nostocoides sp.]
MSVTVQPLPGVTFGAQIVGADLRDLSEAGWNAIERSFNEFGVLLVKGQSLTKEEHVAFAERLGDIEVQTDQTMSPDFIAKPVVLDISNVDLRPVQRGQVLSPPSSGHRGAHG